MTADEDTRPLRSELAAFLRHALTDELLHMLDCLLEPWRLSIADEAADNLLRPRPGRAGPRRSDVGAAVI